MPATLKWRGDAPLVAQVSTATVTAYDATTTYGVIINGKTVSVLGSGGSTTTVATALTTALNASIIPEFAEITWSSNGAVITGTADTKGKPFTFTTSEAGGAGTIGDFAAVTASSGPNDVSLARNWDDGTAAGQVPVDGDTAYLQNSSVSLLYNLDQSAVDLVALIIDQSFTGRIGLPRINADSSTTYTEYREQYWKITATTITIGQGAGAGSGRIKLNTGTVQTVINIYDSGTPLEAGIKSIIWQGTHVANVVNITKGSFAAAQFGGETANVATLTMGYKSSQASDADVYLGSGVTLTTVHKSGGTLSTNSNFVTLTQMAGETIIYAGTLTTLNLYGGAVRYRSQGLLGTLNVYEAEIDYRQDMRTRTVTTCNLYAGAKFYDPFEKVTWTNPMNIKAAYADVHLDIGTDITLARA